MTKSNKPRPSLFPEPRDVFSLPRHPAVDPFWPLNDDPPRKPAATREAELAFKNETLRQQLEKAELQRKAGGKESGKTRLAAAEKAYRNHALDLALEIIRTKKKSISQESLAAEILCKWKSETPCRKSMLVPLIREWDRALLLPGRRK
jgi:hypothetical protein